jgi:hypothetical protein
VLRALDLTREGVAVVVRSVFIESVGRYHNLFEKRPPSKIAQFTERVPMVKGRLDQSATTATSYAWLVWQRDLDLGCPRLIWVPPCRKRLERSSDYDAGIMRQPELELI